MAFRKRPRNPRLDALYVQRLACLAQRVHMRRRELGLTQKQLADQCDVPYQVLSRIEQGKQDLYATRLGNVADALGVTIDYLLGRTDTSEDVLACKHAESWRLDDRRYCENFTGEC